MNQVLCDVISGRATFSISMQHSDGGSGTNNGGLGMSFLPEAHDSNQAENDTSTSSELPCYKMSRSICTVKDLWREWTVGIAGGQAVKDLEAKWGTKWRSNSTETRFFNRRRKILKKVEQLVESKECSSIDAAIAKLDNVRVENNASLDWLQKHIEGIRMH